MKKYICELCGYEYDPAVGDPENGVAPGTAFESLRRTGSAPCAVRPSPILRKPDLHSILFSRKRRGEFPALSQFIWTLR